MIKGITITNHLGESIYLDLLRPEESGFIIKSISGLGPVKANVNFTELVTSDGAIDNSARLSYRNIVMNLIFIEKPTIEDTRLLAYKFFPIKRNITFTIETDRRICETTGRIEKNDPSIFDKQEGCQISILCPYPYFYSAGENALEKTIFYGIEPLFEFEFENESLDEDLLEFGDIKDKTDAVVYYEGDAEVGITILIHANGPVKGFRIYDINKRQILSIDDDELENLTGSGIIAGDEITINTVKSNKNIFLLRAGTLYNILNALGKPISWFQLSKGDNVFAYQAEEGLSNIEFQIENRILYEGV